MILKVLYLLAFLSQYRVCYEIEEFEEEEVPYELVSASEVDNIDTSVIDQTHLEETTEEDVVETEYELAQDEDSDEDIPTVHFAGPVRAKGSISMAASFGYDGPTNYPSMTSIGPPWFPPSFFTSPFGFTPIPLHNMFPGANYPQTNYKDNKIDGKEIFLNITPLVVTKDLSEACDIIDKPKAEEIIDGDCPEYDDDDDENMDNSTLTDIKKESEIPETTCGGAVFGGFVPAKGSVKIAAMF